MAFVGAAEGNPGTIPVFTWLLTTWLNMIEFCLPLIDDNIVSLLKTTSPVQHCTLKTNAHIRLFVLFVKQRIHAIIQNSIAPAVCDEQSAMIFCKLTLQRCFSTLNKDFWEEFKPPDKGAMSSDSSTECPVCHEPQCDTYTPCCANSIHAKCAEQCLAAGITTCVLCRSPL